MDNHSKGTCPPNCNCCDEAGSSDICYVDASKKDKSASEEMREVNDLVWKNVKPPVFSLERPIPPVTARKVDVIRAQLMDKARYRSPLQSSKQQ